MSVINQNLLLTPEGYQISRSVRLRSSASAYFNRTPASAGNRSTWTWSGWVKRGVLGSSQNTLFAVNVGATDTTYFQIAFGTVNPDCLLINSYNITSLGMQTAAVFRDPSAWYHVVFALDTTQATASNRMKLYVNGVQQTSFLTYINYPALNSTFAINTAAAHNIGASNAASNFDGYMTEVNFIDGQALTPSSFGENDVVTGVWKPKKYAGTYGTNGFYLNFSDNSAATAAAIGKDYSGNGNNWTPNNISVTAGVTYDSMLDVPTMWADGGNGRGNYCTMNPLSGNSASITDGNLNAGFNASQGRMGTIAVNSGKWYWECSFVTPFLDACMVGIANPQDPNVFITSPTGYGYYSNANKVNNSSAVAYGATFGVSDTVGVALDLDAGSLTFYKNGTSQGVAYTGLSGTFCPAFATNGSGSSNFRANFGQRPFAYTPPTGFKALNTQNLPEPTIKKGNQYFDATTYTGNGSTRSVVNSAAMQPDFVWIKRRDAAGSDHYLADAVRGATKQLISNSTAAETTNNGLTSFNASGFSVGAVGDTNANTGAFAAWQWKESASAGFDIVTYTGDGTSARAISHSLGVAPKMVIVKTRSLAGENWNCWHTSLNNTAARILLNTTGAVDTGSPTIWGTGGINPTSTTFQVGSSSGTNGNTATYVAYLFAEVAGYSKFGSYTGNGSADGPMVFCGFQPRFVMVKGSSNASSWQMFDTSRSTYNQTDNTLWADLSNAEGTGTARIDLLSNGFKVRAPAGTDPNVSSQTYIYAAFAENPTKYSLAR